MPSWRCRAVPGWSNGSGHVSHSEVIRGSLQGIFHAGHVAHSGCIRGPPGVRSRDTWRARVISRGNSRRECLGTRGSLEMLPDVV